MVKVYGQSDAEKEFLKYANSIFRRIRINDVYQFNDFKQYPHKYKNQILNNFDNTIIPLNSKISFLESELSKLRIDEKNVNYDLARKINAVKRYWGRVRDQINLEIEDLRKRKNYITSKTAEFENQLIDLKFEVSEQHKKKEQAVYEVNEDISLLDKLGNDFEFNNRLKGAWGEKKVINFIEDAFQKEKEVHLINAFNIDVIGKGITINDRVITENKIDHVLLCQKGFFILETKSWASVSEFGIQKIIDQLKKTRTTLATVFDDRINKNVNFLLISTETAIDIPTDSGFFSLRLPELKDFILKRNDVLSKDDIYLILSRLLPHLDSEQITPMSKANIQIKTNIIKGKQLIKGFLRK